MGRLRIRHGAMTDLVITPEEVPEVIDELPVLATLGTFGGSVTVSGAGELRVKESDRIAELVAGLRAMGADADERPDGFQVRGRRAPHGRHRARAVTITGSPWRSRSPRSGATRPDARSTAPMRWRCRIPRSSTISIGSRSRKHATREGGQDLSGRLHGRGQDDASRAPWASGWTGRSRTSTRASSSAERRDIPTIFRDQGEPYFRAREREALIDLLPERGAVVASGGGTFADAVEP